MEYGYATPIDHSKTSAAVTTVGGAAAGGLKGGLTGWFLGGLIPLAAAVTAIAFIGFATLPAVVGSLAIGVLGLAGAYAGAMIGGAVGAGVGGWNGGSRAINQVKLEQGAANELQANVQAYKYQAQAMNQNSGTLRDSLPAQGAQMNQALSNIQADTAQSFGPVAQGQQLQRA